MSATQDHDRQSSMPAGFEAAWAPKGGAVAGLVATVTMSAAIAVMDLNTLRVTVAGLYGQSGSLVAGWVAHLVHGAFFGVVFATVLADPSLYRVRDSVPKSIGAGVVYGLVLAVVGAGVVMPMWLWAVGVAAPPVPNVTGPSLVWHLVYGVVLGAVFSAIERL